MIWFCFVWYVWFGRLGRFGLVDLGLIGLVWYGWFDLVSLVWYVWFGLVNEDDLKSTFKSRQASLELHLGTILAGVRSVWLVPIVITRLNSIATAIACWN